MSCQKCGSKRMAGINGKSSDCNSGGIANLPLDENGDGNFDAVHSGYVPRDWGIGGGDYIDIDFCLDCGQLSGKWPRPLTELEKYNSDETCRCGGDAEPKHTCPFAEEIRGDSDSLCNCCDDCRRECRQNIYNKELDNWTAFAKGTVKEIGAQVVRL